MELSLTYSQKCRQERLEIRRRAAAKRHIRTIATVFSFMFLVVMVISANAIIANAGQGYDKEYQKLYTSIVVEPGETVWEIAEENMTPGYETIMDLIEEISFINGLDDSCTIKSGRVLVIPYYSEV